MHRALGQLAKLPPLVTSWEIENLKHQLAEATRGDRFLLQGGDCSESFEDCESAAIASKLKILLQMSLVLVQGGQEARDAHWPFRRPVRPNRARRTPRRRKGVTLPSYRGDMINRGRVHPGGSGAPIPSCSLRAYERSGLTDQISSAP